MIQVATGEVARLIKFGLTDLKQCLIQAGPSERPMIATGEVAFVGKFGQTGFFSSNRNVLT